MKSKKQSQSKFMRILSSPIRALGKARDAYVRSITNCGQSMTYGGNPLDDAGRFSAFSRSQSAASSRSDQSTDDFAELVRAASARTLINRIDVDLVLKQQQQQQNNSNGLKSKNNKGLPKSSSVGMAKIDEEKPFEYSSVEGGSVAFVPGSVPRSKSYAVGNRDVSGF